MKKKIAVIFGGQSSEHVVSCMSAQTIIKHINRETYDIFIVGVTEEGKWLLADGIEAVEDGSWKDSKIQALLTPDASVQGLIIIKDGQMSIQKLDVVFPVLHGMYGEDGTIQGILEMSGIPYVGCGVLASAVSMDKLYTKIIVDTLGIRQAKYVAVMRDELKDMKTVLQKLEEKLPYPVFVKPSCAGSSRGVSPADNRTELEEALRVAAEHDRKLLVEETIAGREIECAVLGGGAVKASGVGEILTGDSAQFYDFEAKYYNADSKTVVDPLLPGQAAEEIREDAVKIFNAVDGYGLARVDFFVENDTGEVIFNEINTMPGFTAISMYPLLWEHKGMDKTMLVEKLIQLSFSRN